MRIIHNFDRFATFPKSAERERERVKRASILVAYSLRWSSSSNPEWVRGNSLSLSVSLQTVLPILGSVSRSSKTHYILTTRPTLATWTAQLEGVFLPSVDVATATIHDVLSLTVDWIKPKIGSSLFFFFWFLLEFLFLLQFCLNFLFVVLVAAIVLSGVCKWCLINRKKKRFESRLSFHCKRRLCASVYRANIEMIQVRKIPLRFGFFFKDFLRFYTLKTLRSGRWTRSFRDLVAESDLSALSSSGSRLQEYDSYPNNNA